MLAVDIDAELVQKGADLAEQGAIEGLAIARERLRPWATSG